MPTADTADHPEYVGCLEAARMLGCSRYYVAKIAREGRLRSVHKNAGRTGSYLFRVADVQAYRDARSSIGAR